MKNFFKTIEIIQFFFKNSYKLLGENYQKDYLKLSFLMVIGVLAEFLNVALIIPLISLIVDNSYSNYFEYFIFIDSQNQNDLIIFFSISFLLYSL